jgi:hypothetical protein
MVGASDEATSWEDWNVLVAKFPNTTSCGQAVSQGGGGVTLLAAE